MELKPPGVPLFGGKKFGGFLFDMDGTLLTSIEASTRVWSRWAAGYGLDATTFLPQSHGMRVVEVIERLKLTGVDAVTEADAITRLELADMLGVHEVPGARRFLDAVPPTCWAIVTSAPRALALARLGASGLPIPEVLVTAEDIEHGKPDPSCYLLAARRLNICPKACIVFEDAEPGIRAGLGAGADVLVVTATHEHAMITSHPTVHDYTSLTISQDGGLAMI
jgi:sugar-phosphatase